MAGRCPFCWDRSVSPVRPPVTRSSGGFERRLMECRHCEKWYWGGSEEEIMRLFEICATSVVSPGRCYAEIREAVNSGGTTFPRCRTAEFNWLCSRCPNGRFQDGKIGARSTRSLPALPG